MYSCGPPHMNVQKQDDQHELTYSNYVRTQDVTLKTCRRRWMIGRSGEWGSGISALAARHDDYDIYTYIKYMIHKRIVRRKNFFTNQNSFVSTQLNGFKYSYLTLIIWFNINHLFAHSEVVSSITHIDSCVYTQLKRIAANNIEQIL